MTQTQLAYAFDVATRLEAARSPGSVAELPPLAEAWLLAAGLQPGRSHLN